MIGNGKKHAYLLASLVWLSFVMETTLFAQLRIDKQIMFLWDPTEIIAKSMDRRLISKGVFLSLGLYLPLVLEVTMASVDRPGVVFRRDMVRRWRLFGGVVLVGGSLVTWACAILCGASPWVDVRLTAWASLYFSGVAVSPVMMRFVFLSSRPKKSERWNVDVSTLVCLLEYLRVDDVDVREDGGGRHSGTRRTSERPRSVDGTTPTHRPHSHPPTEEGPHVFEDSFVLFFGALSGLIGGTAIVPLDWGAQIQRWPNTMLLGTWVGYGVGVVTLIVRDVWGGIVKS